MRFLTGKDPVLRKSFDALISQMGDRANNVVWDYSQLLQIHNAKGGIWVSEGGE
jgi:hypothetical protein